MSHCSHRACHGKNTPWCSEKMEELLPGVSLNMSSKRESGGSIRDAAFGQSISVPIRGARRTGGRGAVPGTPRGAGAVLGAGRAVPIPRSPKCRVRPVAAAPRSGTAAARPRRPLPASPGRQGHGVPQGSSWPHAFPCPGPAAAPRGLSQPDTGRGGAGPGQREGPVGAGSTSAGRRRIGNGVESSSRNKTTEPPSPPSGVGSRARKMCGAGVGSAPRLSEVRLGEPRPGTPRTAGTP